MPLQSLGTIPENTRGGEITTFNLGSVEPAVVVARRGSFDELIYARGGGDDGAAGDFVFPWSYGSSLDTTDPENITLHLAKGSHFSSDCSIFYAAYDADGLTGPQGPTGATGPTGPQGEPGDSVRSFVLADLVAGGSGLGVAGQTQGETILLVGSSVAGDGFSAMYRWSTSDEGRSHDYVDCIAVTGQGYWHRVRRDLTQSISGAGATSINVGVGLVTASSGTPIASANWADLLPGHVLTLECGPGATSLTMGSEVIYSGQRAVFVAANGAFKRIGDQRDLYQANATASGAITLPYLGQRATYAYTLVGNTTITFPGSAAGAQSGDTIDLLLLQGSAGGYTCSFASGADTGAYIHSNDTGNSAGTLKTVRFVRSFGRWTSVPRFSYSWA